MVNLKQRLEDGYIHVRTIIEVLGSPKEHVEETIHEYVKKIKDDEGYEVIESFFSETEKKDEMWLVYVELEFVTKNITNVVGFCFDYMPSSIEILAPSELKFKEREFAGLLNDLQAKLHNLDMAVKETKLENNFLKSNVHGLVLNLITIILHKASLTLDDISTFSGINKDELDHFLNQLIAQKRIKKEGEKYIWLEKNA